MFVLLAYIFRTKRYFNSHAVETVGCSICSSSALTVVVILTGTKTRFSSFDGSYSLHHYHYHYHYHFCYFWFDCYY